ncbi:MAG: hypothetical protein AUJ23_03305 [Candidatus Magasanikbacteria bacterium CG1_02_32_51]|uniref:Capsule synthesis protein CapA domain-containing protein n=1 Tax=Candidatus Magasanikbacteria bacterium CG1_02_32_51 TaxID=1805238 RepID=A0A1J4U7T3_9BACT|nr:MAG: hypothetical protein AUJ23_03305 [Candidatus Magasanikbacteria bacterium CG1_02_32_51]
MFELPNQLNNKWKILAIISFILFLCAIVFSLLWYFLFYLEPASSKITIVNANYLTTLEVPQVETKKIEEPNKEIKKTITTTSIMFVGDIMLDRAVFYIIKKNNNDFSFPFAKITGFLASADFRIGNLEGPITNNKSIIKAGDANDNGGNLRFTFSPSASIPLAKNFDLLSLANNHTTNFANDGVMQTKKYLNDAGINYFGDFYNRDQLSYIYEVSTDLKIAIVGYHQFYNGGLDNVLSEIKRIKTEKLADLLIVYPHWGTEYLTLHPDSRQTKLAHQFVDAGADIIIGSHPHVVQPIEIYKDKPIFYSLGNFIFDQYFSKETKEGLLLNLSIEKDDENLKTKIYFLPINITINNQAELMEEKNKKQVLDTIAINSDVSEETKSGIKEGLLEFSF